MTLVLTFSVVLVIALLLSELAHRSVLSTAALFLVSGLALSRVGIVDKAPSDPVIMTLAEIALFSVLFTDGMRVGLRDLASAWRLPSRALLLGLPLTLLATALLSHFVAGLPWPQSFLLGAVLSPTDPVLASAIVGRAAVPGRLRHLLNVESGLNDGLALPVVLALLTTLRHSELELAQLGGELLLGLAIGVVLPISLLTLERTRFFAASPGLAELFPFSIGLLIFAVGLATHANLFLAAFAGGITVATVSPSFRDEFERFGSLLSELIKLVAIFVFGTLISPQFLAGLGATAYLFAVLTLLLARPAAIAIALLGSAIDKREWAAAAWFGPKGFASVVYGLIVAGTGVPLADEVFHLAAVVVAGSILLHSSTDVLIARQFARTGLAEATKG